MNDLKRLIREIHRRSLSVEWALAAEEVIPLAVDAYTGITAVYHAAMILALAGEEEAALERIEVLLEEPSIFSRAGVRLEPAFEGLRDHPRFVELAGRS